MDAIGLSTHSLLGLAGSMALLLRGMQTVVQRAFEPDLRCLLGLALRRRVGALASGLDVTAVLQSSTTTGLMVAGFC
jgi:phosphate:Na+ symporter